MWVIKAELSSQILSHIVQLGPLRSSTVEESTHLGLLEYGWSASAEFFGK